MNGLRHIGISFGRVTHWRDGLGEFSRQLGFALAREASRLRVQHGVSLHYHLPSKFHGEFGPAVGYLGTHTTQRWWHRRPIEFSLWHSLHQHNRLKPPADCAHRIETVHDLNFMHTKRGAKLERYRKRLEERLAGCDRTVAISAHVMRDLRQQVDVKLPMQVIYNGVTDLTAHAQREIDGLPGTPFLLHVSRMAPTKNIVALLDLAAHWPERRFVLAGADSPYTRDVERGIAERGLTNVLIRLDLDTSQKTWAYAHCDGFLFPSLAEGFGLPPLEAMHFGKPTFLSKLTSLPEVGGDAAFYFDSFDPAAMRSVIEAGLAATANPVARARIAAHANQFTWPRCAEQYIALYLQVLGIPPAS